LLIIVLAVASMIVGIFLLYENISRGSTLIGVLGLSTGLGSLWQLRRIRKLTP
jgi:hypothetical protein